MPGGLRPVEQRFDADATGYLAEISKIIAANREVLASIREVQKARIDVDNSGALAGIAEVRAALAGLRDKEVTVTVKYVTVGDKPGAGPGLGPDHAAMIRELREISASMDMATDSMGRMETHLGVISRSVQDSSASLDMQTQMLRDNAAAHEAVAVAAGRSAGATRDAAAVARDAASARYSSAMADYLTAKAAAGAFGGGGGGGLGAAAAALGGGGGGGGPGTAAAHFAAAAGFVKRWYPAFHWAMMLSNELLATVGPAVAAAGAGGLVGLQGGQQVANRLQAIYSVAESLGPSLGTTTGQFLGGGNALQQAQNLAGGGVYELLGGGINIAKTSASGGFAQLGLNTVNMLDRAMANIVKDFQGPMGKQILGLTAGGTGYLQQFGDIAANVGHTFLNVAPNLPGAGGDLLSILQGGTGVLSRVTGGLGPALGPILAFEAGSRWGPALVGGAGRLLSTAGRPLITAGTTLAGDAAEAIGLGGGGELAGLGLSAGLGITSAGTGLARGGAFLGGLSAPAIGAIAAGVYTLAKGITYQTPFQQQMGQTQAGINQSGFLTGIPNLISGMQQAAGTPYGAPDTSEKGALSAIWGPFTKLGWKPGSTAHMPTGGFGGIFHAVVQSLGAAWSEITTGTSGPANYDVAQQHLKSMSDQFVNLLNAGPQVQAVWKGVSHSAVSMADAFNIATMAQLQLGSAFTQAGGKNAGQLTSQAKQMIRNLYAGYAPMVMNTGQFGAATGAVTAMQGLGKTQLSTVNSSLDQLVQIVSGGASGAAAYSGLVGALPQGTQQALTSFTAPASATSPGSAAAWAAFASTTQPSVISQLQQQTDWQRTAQTLGAVGAGGAHAGTTGMTAYLLGQALPSARSSPAAMAMLSTIAQEYGGPAIHPGESASAMFRSLNHWARTNADTSAQYNQAMTTTTEKASRIPQDAQQFVQTAQGQLVGGLAQGIATYGSGLQTSFMQSIGMPGMGTAAGKYAQFLQKSGVPEQGALDMAQYAASLGGATRRQLAAIQQTVELTYKVKAPPPTPKPPPPSDITYNVKGKAEKVIVPKPPDQSFQIRGHLIYPAIPHPANQTYTITAILRTIGSAPGIAGATLPGAGGTRIVHGQHGFKVPGYGGGDVWGPAMLEGGEVVVPKHMVAAGELDHLRGRIPGFQGGVLVPSYAGGPGIRAAFEDVAAELLSYMQQALSQVGTGGSRGFAGGFTPGGLRPGVAGMPPHGTAASLVAVHVASVSPAVASGGGFGGAPLPVPAAAQKVFDAFEKTFKGMGSPWGKLASQILAGLEDGIKNAPHETAKMAQALVNKVQAEIAYGRGVTSAAVQGLNLGGMQVAAPTMTAQGQPYQLYADQQNIAAGGQPGSVQEQMGSYLQAMKSFQGDMGKLAKGGLEKRLMSQLFAAGPVQGDALAQSILGGAGGAKGANQMYNQISSLATKLGVSAVGDVYGMPATHPAMAGLHGKAVRVGVHADTAAAQAAINAIHGKSVNVTVHLNITTGGGGGGGVNLSPGEIKQVTQKVQAALLQQAKRNRRTGLALPGYGS